MFHRGLSRLAFQPATNQSTLSFSVIIAARNEADCIANCLDHVTNQTYDSSLIEIVVVDDRSTDDTALIVSSYAARDNRIRLVRIEECPQGFSPKKYAVSAAVKIAKNEILVFTDADSSVPSTWINSFAECFNEETVFVSGLTNYHRPPKMSTVWFNLQQTDFLSHGIVSASAISGGFPLNTNANNLAVRKEAFLTAKGYDCVSSIVSGDDDLLLQMLAKSGKSVRFAPGKEITVTTEPAADIREWWEQRKRWGSKTVYYNKSAVIILSLIFSYYTLILFCALLSIFIAELRLPAFLLFMHKTLLDALLFYRGSRRLECNSSILWFGLLAPIHIPAIVFAVAFGVFGRFSWKDGSVRRKL
jgi:cellulose synthase/poly-beta-1,6-N-acetylglucosamine synthase-like glycosyltransferase